MRTEEDQKEFRQGFLYHMLYNTIDESVVARLKECGYYQGWQEELSKIMKKHPEFESLLLKGEGAVSLTEEEHELFVSYHKLLDNMQSAQKQQCYYVGLIHAGIILEELAEYTGSASAVRQRCNPWREVQGADGESQNQEDEQEMMKKFFQLIRDKREKNLKGYPEYQELKEKERKLLKKQPFIQQLAEGNDTGEKTKLTRARKKALIDFLALQKEKSTYELLVTLFIGCRSGMGLAEIQ